MNRLTVLMVGLLTLPSVQAAKKDDDLDYLFSLNLEELAELNVISASNLEERLADAPATVIVISKKDITERGYLDVSEIFNDLPGMEVIRPWGDTYFVNYMRGYRYTIGSPYLVMVDGVVLNTMYFGITTPMAALPMSDIERIEVVYGPASSVFGANAFMGVINIITDSASDQSKPRSNVNLTVGDDGYRIVDGTYYYQGQDWRLRFATRLEFGALQDRIDTSDVYWLSRDYYNSSDLWGGFANQGDGFDSYIRHKSFDLRLSNANSELALEYTRLDSGYGTVYPADRILSGAGWPRYQYGAYFKHTHKLSDNIQSKTLLRYRSDGIPNDTFDIEAWNETNLSDSPQNIGGIELQPGESARMLHLSYWQSLNDGWSAFQDFDIKLSDKWQLVTGLKYEYKDLQKAYNIPTVVISPLFADPANPDIYPEKPGEQQPPGNKIVWEDSALYWQGKYRHNDNHIFNFGMRIDHNSQYGTESTLRSGYVGHFSPWTFKLLYGQAFQEPVPRSLYGAWAGSGSDPTLKPEQSETLEASLGYRDIYTDHLLSLYYINNTETAVNFTGGAKNLGNRHITGVDYHYRRHTSAFGVKLRLWAYLSLLLKQSEERFDPITSKSIGWADIGDLAKTKLHLGATANISEHLSATFRARYIGSRDTAPGNPIETIGGFATFDANFIYHQLIDSDLDVSLKISNLLDRRYYHPGIRDADAEDPLINGGLDTIGWYGDNGLSWQGSSGWFNARLPQPGRTIQLTLHLRF